MSSFALYVILALTAAQQPEKAIPKDSVEIDAPGCLKGRVFTGAARPADEGVVRGPNVEGRHFRLAGPREVMNLVKKYDGSLVQLVGVVRKAALDDAGIEGRRGRVGIGAPGMDPTRMNSRNMPSSVATMDVSAVKFLSERCPLQ
jgi:hypothetical protein